MKLGLALEYATENLQGVTGHLVGNLRGGYLGGDGTLQRSFGCSISDRGASRPLSGRLMQLLMTFLSPGYPW